MSQCKSSWGAYDLSGNFREWTASQPKGKDVRRIVKGGMRQNPTKGTRCAFTTDESIAFKNATMGFRCCLDVDELPFEPPAPPADEGEPTPE